MDVVEPLVFVNEQCPPGKVVAIEAKVETIIYGQYIKVDHTIAAAFTIEDIVLDGRSQSIMTSLDRLVVADAASPGLPAKAVADDISAPVRVSFAPCCHSATILVRNTSDKTLPFRGRIEGVGPRVLTPEESEAWLSTPRSDLRARVDAEPDDARGQLARTLMAVIDRLHEKSKAEARASLIPVLIRLSHERHVAGDEPFRTQPYNDPEDRAYRQGEFDAVEKVIKLLGG